MFGTKPYNILTSTLQGVLEVVQFIRRINFPWLAMFTCGNLVLITLLH